MAGAEYRLFFGTRPATAEELDRVEEIIVEQEADMAWEARLRLALCVDGEGRWQHQAESFAEPFSRVRLELRQSEGEWTPLIDGPVAGQETALDSQPGRSAVTLLIRDDSVLMNREEAVETFEDKLDSEIAGTVFASFQAIGQQNVETTPGPQRTAVRRGTAIQFLRELARANGFRAYVLPGAEAGASIGCFKPDPRTAGSLPPLVLLGADRNLADLQVQENSEGPERTRAWTLRLSDQGVVTQESTVQDVGLMRPLPAIAEDQAAIRLLPPTQNTRDDPAAAATAQARRAAYALKVSGRIVPGCYPGVLAPYERVLVRTGDLPLSGEWLITKVVHRIGPNLYAQELEAMCDSRAEPAAAGSSPTGLSVSFSASLSVF